MTVFNKAMAAVFGSALLLTAAPAAAQQFSSIDELLSAVRADSAEQERVNRQRVNEFQANASQQTALLNEARAELRAAEAQARQVETRFAANERRIDALKA